MAQSVATARRASDVIAFASVTTLFFAWGFISANNDPLIVSLRAIFQLGYAEGLVTQLMFFLGYGVMSLPAAAIANRIGAVNTILLALAMMMAGCLLVGPAARLDAYAAILMSLFVLALGITTLQVATNPLAAALGPPASSHFRLNLAQAFNSLGMVAGVYYGAHWLLADPAILSAQAGLAGPALRGEALNAISLAFATIALWLAALWLFLWLQRRRIAAAVVGDLAVSQASVLGALRSRWALFGAAVIGLYVGAEVAIGSVMINFLNQTGSLALPLEQGGRYLANFYWGGALAGRFLGSALLTRISATKLLAGAALVATTLCGVVVFGHGPATGHAALAVGFCNSIMFPTIFSLTLERSSAARASTSGLLCLAIASGAVLPLTVGAIADRIDISTAFIVPALAYLVIAAFGMIRPARAPVRSRA